NVGELRAVDTGLLARRRDLPWLPAAVCADYVDSLLLRGYRERLSREIILENRRSVRHLKHDERSVGRDPQPPERASNEGEVARAIPAEALARPVEPLAK